MEPTKRCMDCGEDRPLSAFRLCYNGTDSETIERYAKRNPTNARQNRCKRCYGNRERSRYRIQFLEAYGGCCACCGENDPRFLSLDHAKDDGNEHRKSYTCQQIYIIAKREGYPKDKYQILCYNCNFGKSVNGGVCPHKTGLSVEEAWEYLHNKFTYIGKKHHDSPSRFSGGHDERRMQLSRRVLKPCPFCGVEFGTHEMARHKREKHKQEVEARRQECLKLGRGNHVDGARLVS